MPKRTPFYDIHVGEGAKIVEFAGFDMPIQYQGIKVEHNAVREAAGMFDVSHMGEFRVTGSQALDLIQKVTINDVAALVPGKAQYSAMCYENGGIVDDLIVYMLAENEYLLVVNAANIDKDFAWIAGQNDFKDAQLTNESDNWCLLAVQGPNSPALLQTLTPVNLSDIPYYGFTQGEFAGENGVIISATGYTGEKGFEIYFDKNTADPEAIWIAIMNAGKDHGLVPVGLGARDTLRLEMGFALYGNDITSETNPIEAGLGWLTKLDASEFLGKTAVAAVKAEKPSRRLRGFVIEESRALARGGCRIADAEGNTIGQVTSGGMSISLGKGIGLGYVASAHAKFGKQVYLDIRKKLVPATLVKPPFIKK